MRLPRSNHALAAVIMLACLGSAGAAGAADPAVFKVGSFTKLTTTGSQEITHNLGATPKALILYTGFEAGETATTEGIIGIGFYDGSNAYSLGYGVSHNANPISATRRAATTAIQILNGAGTLHAEASVTAWSSSTFTLNWTTNQASASVVHYAIIGGAHVSAKALTWGTGTSAGSVAVSSVGFRPNVCFHVSSGTGLTMGDGIPHQEDHASIGFGAMDQSGRNWAMVAFTDDKDTAGEVSVARRIQVTDAAVVFGNGSTGVISKRLAASSMDSNGFTVTLSGTELGSDSRVLSLCLQSVHAYVGNFTKSTSTSTPVSQPVTGPSFTPGFLFLGSYQHTTSSAMETQARIGIGMSDGSTEGCLTTSNEDNSTSADGYGIDKVSKVAVKMDNVTGTTNAEADLASFNSNGFTLSWTTNDAVATQYLYVALATPSASAVTLESFDATRTGDELDFRWRTGFEHDSLGFHVVEERAGIKRRLTRELIAGSALLVGGGQRLGAGGSFAWRTRAPNGAGARYWLEELDVSGRTTSHGPVSAVNAPAPLPTLTSPPLSAIGRRGPPPSPATLPPLLLPPPPVDGSGESWPVAGAGAIKIAVRSDGWYRINGRALIAAGLPRDVDPRKLALFSSGRPVHVVVSGEEDGRLDDDDALEFYGLGADTLHTDTRIYWLTAGEAPGARIALPAAAPPASVRPLPFRRTLLDRPRSVYMAALLNDEGSNLFGPAVTSAGLERMLEVHHLAQEGAAATLEVALQGASDAAHDVAVLVNGVERGRVSWSGRAPRRLSFPVPVGADGLLEGGNRVLLRSSDSKDVALLAELALHYDHEGAVDGDADRLVLAGGQPAALRVHGPQRVFDVSDPFAVSALPMALAAGDGAAEISFTPEGAGPRTVLLVGPTCARAPESVLADRPSAHAAAIEPADLVIIGHGSLLPAVAPLVALRQEQGARVASIDVEDLYDELNHGHRHPRAIRAYLEAAARAGKSPKHVLLLGDASFDPRNQLGRGDAEVVPTRLVDTWPLETASDDWFADFAGDGLPSIALGRIPARTLAEAEAIIAKLVRHERTGVAGQEGLLFVADPDEETLDFGEALRAAAAHVPDGYTLDLRAPGTPAASLLDALAAGPLLVDYVGHGTIGSWKSGLDVAAAARLGNRDRPSLVVSMTCLTGMFQDPATPSLAEALLAAPEGGAVAVLASSGFTPLGPQRAINQRFVRAVLEEHLPLGEALRVAKASTEDPARRTFLLFGDPSRVLTTRTPRRPVLDAGAPEADARSSDASAHEELAASPPPSAGGCGCTIAAPSPSALPLVLGLLVLLLRRRRR